MKETSENQRLSARISGKDSCLSIKSKKTRCHPERRQDRALSSARE
jgi:hypothetical protein